MLRTNFLIKLTSMISKTVKVLHTHIHILHNHLETANIKSQVGYRLNVAPAYVQFAPMY